MGDARRAKAASFHETWSDRELALPKDRAPIPKSWSPAAFAQQNKHSRKEFAKETRPKTQRP